MGRIYARSEEVYELSQEFLDTSLVEYKRDNRKIPDDEFLDAPEKVRMYLPERCVDYLKEHPIDLVVRRLPGKVLTYPPVDYEKDIPTISIPTRTIRESYKRELIFFLGQIFTRKNYDIMHLNDFDIPCQYGSFLSILLDLLYCKNDGKEDEFSIKYLNELKGNASRYSRIYERYNKYQEVLDINKFIIDTLTFLQPFSSMDAVLQVNEKYGDNVEELRKLIDEYITNENHNNREHILLDRGIDTVGFKALRKELKRKER